MTLNALLSFYFVIAPGGRGGDRQRGGQGGAGEEELGRRRSRTSVGDDGGEGKNRASREEASRQR